MDSIVKTDTTHRKFVPIRSALSAAGMLAALIFLYVLNPNISWYLPPCPFHALTGFYCPGCGSTRAMHQLLHGHILAALDLNPLMVISIPFLLYLYIRQALRQMRPAQPVKAIWLWCVLAVIIIYGILRNIPVYPFTLLAP
ncbi:MAG: DUF2752 domain-containing protein [Armatimonadota bacterium]